MTGRRTALLLAIVVAGALGVLLVDPPLAPVPREEVTGPRVVKVPAGAVSGLEIGLAEGRLRIDRRAGVWAIDEVAVGPELAAAIDDLLRLLVEMRAIDRFRDPRDGPFGLDEPIGFVVVEAPGRTVRLALGSFNVARSAVYARRDGHPRVLQLGAYLLAAMDRVFYRLHVERDGDVPAPPSQRPEIG